MCRLQEICATTIHQGEEIRIRGGIDLSDKIPEDARFIEVECKDCSNKQIIFLKPATKVDCLACGSTLATPTGGKADIKGEVVGVVE